LDSTAIHPIVIHINYAFSFFRGKNIANFIPSHVLTVASFAAKEEVFDAEKAEKI